MHATYGSHVKFSGVLRLFARFATVSSNYFLCRFEDVLVRVRSTMQWLAKACSNRGLS